MYSHQVEFSVVKMCKVLKVSKSGYYKWLKQIESTPSEKEIYKRVVQQKIAKSYHESIGTYGSPRVHDDLLEWGYPVSKKTVARYMNEMGLCAVQKEKFVVTTDSDHDLCIYPNLVKRAFNIDKPNRVWVSDITYIRTLEGWVYLASIMDLFSRKIIGWTLGTEVNKELTLTALHQSLVTRQPSPQLIHHSDRDPNIVQTIMWIF
ncbi:IS3 family transposase [Peribacillus sp. B-H-3]|uniref:IS3 family transposase n=1 Tax=Peribacillus sp. B-H-3 TaxID=3400420 RepID=UPI003B01D7B1